ncbi:unnamed protein product [Cuscuta campestris]|uniref:Uncharacterized protein n=1 Tax=Cuscuta campestris TaxID=132261 RepID=A0A484N1I2_9ASTE|nr:unnamed protein product [Cuscuta campestris]
MPPKCLGYHGGMLLRCHNLVMWQAWLRTSLAMMLLSESKIIYRVEVLKFQGHEGVGVYLLVSKVKAYVWESATRLDISVRCGGAEDGGGGDSSDSGTYVAVTMAAAGITVDDDCGSGRRCR